MSKLMALVLVALLALSCRAELTAQDCEPMTHTLPAAEVDKVYGQWVLVAAFADFEAGLDMIGKISTSHLDISLNHDNQAIHFLENNKDLRGVCSRRSSDATVMDPRGRALTLHIGAFEKEQDGIKTRHSASADVVFYKTCPDCLVRVYKSVFSGHESRILFFYRREGKHVEIHKLATSQDYIKKQAKCLNFFLDRHYMYNMKSEFCTKKAEECEPMTHTLPAAEVYKVYGQWVLVAAFADFQGGLDMIGKISTSHLDISLNHDNHAIHFHENNKDLHGVCSRRSSDATVVDPKGTALTLHIGEFEREEDGIRTKHSASADVVFYKTCPDCLVRVYKSVFSGHESRVLFFYRREGKHLEIHKLATSRDYIKKQAECMKFLPDRHYMYDMKSEFCTTKGKACEPMTHTLPAAEVYKVYGHWVLVAAFADFEAGLDMIGKISTSHLDISLNPDNQAIHFHENNKDLHGVCSRRSSDATVVDPKGTATLRIGEFEREQDGIRTKHSASADVVFYKTCPDCLVRVYKSVFSGHESRILFFYRREGKHVEIHKLATSQDYIRKQADCLKFMPDRPYMYDMKSEFCTKKAEECEPMTHTLPAAEVYKVYGQWVLVAAFADFEAGLDMIGKISTSHLDISPNPDNQAIHFLENNKDLHGVCSRRSSDATVVDPKGSALTLYIGEFEREQDGFKTRHSASADVILYKTCPDCLVRIYKSVFSGHESRILFFYRREGKHLEADKLATNQHYIKKQAECLKFLLDRQYMYDGKSEVCTTKTNDEL